MTPNTNISQTTPKVNGVRMVILGAGESGIGAAKLALKQGFDVFVSDFGEIPAVFKAELEKMGVAFEPRL
jgi:UDP-N-acetylmuramoylalanine--D-glutamate ligase